MSASSLLEIWNGAAAHPFQPVVSKDYQFFVGFSLLAAGTSLKQSLFRIMMEMDR